MEHIQASYDEGLEILYGNDSNGGLINLVSQLERVLSHLTKDSEIEHNMDTAYEALLNFQEEIKELSSRFRNVPNPEIDSDMSFK